MTAIGKLLAVLNLVGGLALLTWATNLYTQRPYWFEPAPEGTDKGHDPVSFPQLKSETELLTRAAAAASDVWGRQKADLERTERVRATRRAGYATRIRWAHKGNPRDPVDPMNPKSPGKGFYAPVIDPATRLYDLTALGEPVRGVDGAPLPGLDSLAGSRTADVKEITDLTDQITAQRKEFARLSTEVRSAETRLVKMGVIRDSVQSEAFYLSSFELNVYETRETVLHRQRQLRDRLKVLGIVEP